MSKKSKKDVVDTGAPSELKHNPFASLASLPVAPAPIAVTEPAREEAPSTPAFAPKIVVRRETKGRGGKTVTRVSGITAAHREAMAARMKKALGCGASIEGDDLLLLGSLVDRAADWLEAEGAKRVVRSG